MEDARPRHRRRLRTAHLLARLALAFGILPYGISKMLLIQFQVPAWDYAHPLGETDGRILTWSFLGYSPALQVVLGLLEVVPGLLLVFRRTWRLGAWLLLPVLVQVALINLALDLWIQTRLISIGLLVLDLAVLAGDPATLRRLLSLLLPVASPRRRIARIGEVAVALGLVVGFATYLLDAAVWSRSDLADFAGRRQINGAGTWTIEEYDVPGVESPGAERTAYFDAWNRAVVTVDGKTWIGGIEADARARTFELRGFEVELLQGTYRVDGPRLHLEGTVDGEPFRMVLRRNGWGPPDPR